MDIRMDGTTMVTMYASATDGVIPKNVLARSVSASPVHVVPGVRLTGDGRHRASSQVVDMVTSDLGQITLRLPQR
jgi:hypothetical protein